MYQRILVNNPLNFEQLYGLFIDNQSNLKRLIVDIYSILPTDKLYEKIYLNITNNYNGYLVTLLIDFNSREIDMYKIAIYNVFTQGYTFINKDIYSISQAIYDIRYNKVPMSYPCVQPVHYRL